ncbi:ABC transporter substrate-binding protein [Bacillus benzoevorans]|nr:ABC transporter substrate-binding protein [Bacillus benzoevorans]
MKKVRFAHFLIVTALAGSILAGCANDKASNAIEKSAEDKVLQYQSTVGSVIYPELAADLGYLEDLKLEKVSNMAGGPESIQLTATGETDFGSAFNGAIIKSYAKNIKIKSVVGSYGSDKNTYHGAFVLEGSPIKSAKDFIGKKVGVNILGAHAEFVLKDYLRQNGLTEKEIEQVTLVTLPLSNLEQGLRMKQVDVVIVGGLSKELAIERGGITEIFTDIDIFGGEFTAGEFFFTEKYIKENPNTVKTFVEGTAKAIEWARTTPREEVIARYEKIVSARQGNEPTANLKFFKSPGIAEEGGQIKDKEFQIWIDWLVKSGELKEGQIEAEDLYTNEFNPFSK